MSNDGKYNGWTNYETWAVKLWLDNEYGSYLQMTERASELYAEHVTGVDPEDLGEDAEEDAAREMSDYVEEAIKDANPLADEASVYTDLMNAALSEVNWHEIGESYIGDAKENA